VGAYIPKKGDFVALTFDPQAGHERKGRRPALIVSNDIFNRHTGMAIACPITNTDRHYPFHVAVGEDLAVTGFVMVDQVKSTDFRARRAKRIGKAPEALLNEVLAVLDACVY
jgi:mRNA interferase MazF